MVEMVYSIDEYGDCDFFGRYEDMSPLCDSLQKVSFARECPTGTFGGYHWVASPSAPSTLRFDGAASPGVLKGDLVFSPAMRKGSVICWEHRSKSFNAFSLNVEQRARVLEPDSDQAKPSNRTPDNPKAERVWVIVGHPMETLILSVDFSKIGLPKKVCASAGKGNEEDLHETERCRTGLRLCPISKAGTLVVSAPLDGYNYYLSWELPTAVLNGRLSASLMGKCKKIRANLVGATTADLLQRQLNAIFAEHASALSHEYSTALSDIEVGLMVFDPARNRLRFVAGHLREKTKTYELYDGQGVAGRAHKLGRALAVVPSKVTAEANYLSPPPKGMEQPRLIISVPLKFPLGAPDGEDETVAVLSIGVYDDGSDMQNLYENNERLKALVLESQVFFDEKILPVIGCANYSVAALKATAKPADKKVDR